MDNLDPIPTPVGQRWREFKIQLLPPLIFIAAVVAVVLLWRSYVQPAAVIGEVEAIKANITSLHDGVLTDLLVDRFDEVKKDQPIATIITADSDSLKTQLAVVAAEMAVLRTRINIDERQREQNYHRFRLDILNQKVQVAIAQARLFARSNEFVRLSKLVAQDISSQTAFDNAKADKESLEAEIAERQALIKDLSATLPTMAAPVIASGTDPIKDAIDAKEKEIEEALAPNVLKAPISGVISVTFKKSGEKVLRGEPILTISDPKSTRVIGYIRQPIGQVPTTNDTAMVRTRAARRQIANCPIVRVGPQLEPINPVLLSPDGNRLEHGLPILVSVPADLQLTPGEFVDLAINFKKR